MTAADILKAALGHMEDRAATYDKPEGERSMPATVAAFNALTGHQLTAEQGWLFMTVLKLCRTQQGGFRADNYEDGSAYFALMGEQASGDRLEPTGGIKPGMKAPVNLVAEVMDADRLANSSQSATHRDGGGARYKVCDMSGRWLRHGNNCWFFASSDPKAVPEGLRPL